MTRFAYSRPGVDGRDAAILGTLEFALVNREEVDGRIRTTAKWSARLEPQQLTETDPVTGEESTYWAGVAEVPLPTTGLAQGVRINEHLIPTAGAEAYVVAVSASPPALAVDLPRLDPATLERSDALVPAWESIVAEIQSLRGETVTARDDTQQARVAANEAANAAAQAQAGATQQATEVGAYASQADEASRVAVEAAANAAAAQSAAAASTDAVAEMILTIPGGGVDLDADGVPYFDPSGRGGVRDDTDGVPYITL